jgi:serine protease AprX
MSAGMRRALGTASLAALLATAAGGTAWAAPPPVSARATAAPAPSLRVVVTGDPGAGSAVAAAVRSLGGRVTARLDVVDGVAAELPAAALDALKRAPGVRAVTADGRGRLQGVDTTLGYDVGADDGSLYNVGQITHAKDAWTKGFTGKGVDVALVDSGVAAVKGLTSGNVVQGPDLSFESQDPDMVHKDTFGHGTHMGSIIAGRDAVGTGSFYAKSDSHSYTGVAPDARLVSLKVAAADGGSDVSQVIAAIDWVTQHAHDPGMNIRVLNLSYGTDSTQSPAVDPLAYAVERAWRAGIVVVVASGNDGTSRTQLAMPAIDPLVIAVGADDPHGSDAVGDDLVPGFAQRGTVARHVDVIAPGVHVLGLRVPGGSVDAANAGARVGQRFFRGSGTSQSAAVVSGLVSLYLQKYPQATPDQVKKALMTSSTPPSSVKPLFTGLGVPDVNKAIGAALPSASTSAQPASGATGTGTLEGARGTAHVTNGTEVLDGELDIFGQPWNGAAWAASATPWSGGTWRGVAWTGDTWSSAGIWAARSWTGSDWSARSWTARSWTDHTWSDAGWNARSWTDSTWLGSAWGSNAWSAAGWN